MSQLPFSVVRGLSVALKRMAAAATISICFGSLLAPPDVSAQAQATPVAPPTTVAAPGAPSQGELQLSVVIIDELTPKPVPLTPFRITSPDSANTQTVKTDLQGQIDIHLPTGSYSVENDKPLEFKGHLYHWKGTVTITADIVTKIQWSDADATAEAAKPARQVSDEAVIYNQRKSGVVVVEGDRGRGSGFVVDPRGLILTNAHVVHGGRWVVVRFDRGIRVPAVVVEEDKAADVAVVCVNPAAYKAFTVVPLADPTQGPLAVEGERVLAIGSPLNQEKVLTIGIVSKVEKDYLISDVNINHGNSGGPLLNLAGDAIGLTTFLDSTTNGPGISGIVAITKALPALGRARQKIESGVQLPAAERLPDVSPVPIPEESLTAYTTKDTKPWSTGHPKNFETVIETPFFIASQERDYQAFLSKDREDRIRKRGKEGDQDELKASPAAFWERYALHSSDPVVYVIVRPTLQTKSSSMWGAVFGAMAGVNVPQSKEFRDDFYDMALYRGDTLIHPVHRQRDMVSALYSDYRSNANDSAMGGIYFYDPSDFAPGADLKLYVRRESDLNRWDVVNIDGKEQSRIYQMFLPYRSALAQAGGDTAIQGLSASIHTPPMAGAQWSPEAQEAALQVSRAVTPTAVALPANVPTPIGTQQKPPSAASPPGPPVAPGVTASPAPTSIAPAAPKPAPRLPVITKLPQRVRLVLTNGNVYVGSVTAIEGDEYSILIPGSTLNVAEASIKTLELLPASN